MPLLPKQAFERRHPHYSARSPEWRYFLDHYDGGLVYPGKLNPLPLVPVNPPAFNGGMSRVDFSGVSRYLWQNELERGDNYRARLARAVYINICAPVVDFYGATVGKAEHVVIEPGNLTEFVENVDGQGRSLQQFMAGCRTHAAVFGHTFIYVDSPRASGPIDTQADVERQGIRPYVTEILPIDLLNWRVDSSGSPIEILFCVRRDAAGTIADQVEDCGFDVEYRYVTPALWQVYRKVTDGYELVAEGENRFEAVPLVPLYHRFREPMIGDSLLKDSARFGQLLTNWASGFDESLIKQMFAQLVIKSRKELADVGVGVAIAMHLNPEDDEDASYLAPPTAPFEAGWSAFYRLLSLANEAMGLKSTPITEDGSQGKSQSGVSKQWDFFPAEKVLSAMALNEQEAVKLIMDAAAKWSGKPAWEGTVQYSQKYDLSTLQETIQNLISLQTVNAPASMRREVLRSINGKALPSLPPEKAKRIDSDIDAYGDMPSMEAFPDGRMPIDDTEPPTGPDEQVSEGPKTQEQEKAVPRRKFTR